MRMSAADFPTLSATIAGGFREVHSDYGGARVMFILIRLVIIGEYNDDQLFGII